MILLYVLILSIDFGFARSECVGKSFEDIGFVPSVSGCISVKYGECSDPEDVETKFLFYNSDNPATPCITDHRHPHKCENVFRDGVYTVIITNGFKGRVIERMDPYLQKAKDLYFEKLGEKVNVILVDWSNGSSPIEKNYQQAMANSKVVGRRIAKMIVHLKEKQNLSLKDVLLRGFSLGAQVVGIAARYTFKITGEKVGEIGAEDPASPCFDGFGGTSEEYLTAKDAHLVRVVHTDSGHKGMAKNAGHYDFYPDGGKKMPNCASACIPYISDLISSHDCNHHRAEDLTVIDYQEFGVCQPVSYACENYEQFLLGKCGDCDNDKCQLLGYNIQVSNTAKQQPSPLPTVTDRKFYVKTSAEEPYCEYHFQIKAESYNQLTCGSLYIELHGGKEKYSTEMISDGHKLMTALLTIPSKSLDLNSIAPFGSATLTKASILRTDCSHQIKTISVNFLSHIDKKIRKSYSSVLVKDEKRNSYRILDPR